MIYAVPIGFGSCCVKNTCGTRYKLLRDRLRRLCLPVQKLAYIIQYIHSQHDLYVFGKITSISMRSNHTLLSKYG